MYPYEEEQSPQGETVPYNEDFDSELFTDSDELFDACGEAELDDLESLEAYLDELEAEAAEAEERELAEPVSRKKRFRRQLEGKAQRAFDRQERFRSRGAGGALIRRGGRKGGDRYIKFYSRWSWEDCWCRFGPNWGRWPRGKLRAPDAQLQYQLRHGELYFDYDAVPGDDKAVIYFEPIRSHCETSDLDPHIIDKWVEGWVERFESPSVTRVDRDHSDWRYGRKGRIRFARSFDPSDLRSKQ